MKNTLLPVAVLVCLLCFSAHAQVQIDWASVVSPNASNAAGPPDGITCPDAPGTSTFNGFGQGSGNSSNYTLSSLASFLSVSPFVLAQANFIAFEVNGTAGLTFESGTWTFTDGTNTQMVTHTSGTVSGEPGVLALGNISRTNYMSFFGALTTPPGDLPFILFNIGGNVNVSSSTFGVMLFSPGDIGPNGGTPNLDALGRLAVPEPSTLTLSVMSVLIFALGSRYFRKRSPVHSLKSWKCAFAFTREPRNGS